MRNFHRGPWADHARTAIDAGLAEVGVSAGDYIECQYGDGQRLEPLRPGISAIDVEVLFSEPRQQYRALLRRVPAAPIADDPMTEIVVARDVRRLDADLAVLTAPARAGHRNPYVGAGADGARRSAQIDREEADGLDRHHPRYEDLLSSAARWDRQADELEA